MAWNEYDKAWIKRWTFINEIKAEGQKSNKLTGVHSDQPVPRCFPSLISIHCPHLHVVGCTPKTDQAGLMP